MFYFFFIWIYMSKDFWLMKNVNQCNDQCWAKIVWTSQKLLKLWFLWHYKSDKCQTLPDGTTHWAWPVHSTIIDLDHITRS